MLFRHKFSLWRMEILSLILCLFHFQQPSEGQSSQPTGPSRVAAVGPYIQTTPAPPVLPRQDILVKPAYPDGTATLPKPLPKPTTGTCICVQYLPQFAPVNPDSSSPNSVSMWQVLVSWQIRSPRCQICFPTQKLTATPMATPPPFPAWPATDPRRKVRLSPTFKEPHSDSCS